MQKLTLKDLKPLDQYEKMRPSFLRAIIDLKKRRRIEVGDKVTLAFENRDTVLFQIQEMARVEQLTSPEALQHEIDTYNPLIPGEGELKATLFIEITDQQKLREELTAFIGIDEGCCTVRLGDKTIPIEFEAGRSKEDKISAVHYVTIRFTPNEIAAWNDLSLPAAVVIDHPNYRARAEVPQKLRRELGAELAGLPDAGPVGRRE